MFLHLPSTFITVPPLLSHHHRASTMPTMPPLPTAHQNPTGRKTHIKKKEKRKKNQCHNRNPATPDSPTETQPHNRNLETLTSPCPTLIFVTHIDLHQTHHQFEQPRNPTTKDLNTGNLRSP